MTTEEIAEEAASMAGEFVHLACRWMECPSPSPHQEITQRIVALVLAERMAQIAIAEHRVKAEREACAKVVDRNLNSEPRQIAKEIRYRGGS